MFKNKTLTGILKVSFSNLCIALSGIFVGFIIPKILGVTEYGYYKIFTLYSVYVGIFSMGISEGMYLKYSGISYTNLDKSKIRAFTHIVAILEFCVALLIAILSFIFFKGQYRVIFIALSIYLFSLNMTTYYQYVAQMTLRFSDYSMRNIIRSIFNIISTLILTFFYYFNQKKFISYKYYLFSVLFISIILLLMYIKKFKEVSFGSKNDFMNYKDELIELMKLGIPFLIASVCSTLILTIDSQFISVLFNMRIYGIYAFAYNLLSLVTVFTSAISVVLYPTLKQLKQSTLVSKYHTLSSYVFCFVYLSLFIYFPLCIFIKKFLPQYMESLVFFRIVFPGLAFSSVISVVIQNYYKVINKNNLFFYENLAVLGISFIANSIAYYIFRTPESISFASVLTLIIYYILAEVYFVKNYHIKWRKNFTYALFMMFIFYIITSVSDIYIGGITYILVFLCISFIFYHRLVKDLFIHLIHK